MSLAMHPFVQGFMHDTQNVHPLLYVYLCGVYDKRGKANTASTFFYIPLYISIYLYICRHISLLTIQRHIHLMRTDWTITIAPEMEGSLLLREARGRAAGWAQPDVSRTASPTHSGGSSTLPTAPIWPATQPRNHPRRPPAICDGCTVRNDSDGSNGCISAALSFLPFLKTNLWSI